MAAPTGFIETIAEAGAPSHNDSVALPLAAAAGDPDDIVAVDDLPRPMPVMAKEADVVEMYLAALLDDLLGKTKAPRQKTVLS